MTIPVTLFLLLSPLMVEAASGRKAINDVNVLLPFSREVRVRYTLEAFGGCYFWQSSNPAVISVQGAEGAACSDRVVLQTEAREPHDKIVWILATDATTKEIIRVESRLEQIARIEIITKLRTVEVGDFASLQLMGFDA